MPTTYQYRIQFKLGTIANLASAQYSGLAAIASDIANGPSWGWYNGAVWKYAVPMDSAGNATATSYATPAGTVIDNAKNITAQSVASVNDIVGGKDLIWGAGYALKQGTTTVIDSSLNAVFLTVTAHGGTFTDGLSVQGQEVKKKSFACIYLTGEGAAAQSIPTGASYTKITPFTTNMGGAIGSTPDAANDRITVDRDGIYMVGFTRSYTVGTANTVWHVAVGVNGVIQPQSVLSVKTASTATQNYADLDVPVQCAAGDHIEVFVRHDQGDSVNLTYEHATLYAQAID